MQRSGDVLQSECNRRLVRSRQYFPPFAQKKKSREVAFIVLDACGKYCSLVHGSRVLSGNPCGIAHSAFDHVLHASGSVVERCGLYLRILAKEIPALIERNWVRQSTPDVRLFDATNRNQTVNNSQPEFTLNEDFARQQEVGMFGDGSRQRILDGNHDNRNSA